MSDDDHLDGHDPATSDGHDDELARLLAVPALDDLTRRRLVRAALDATTDATTGRAPEVPAPEVPGRGRRRPPGWAAAAAVTVVVAVAATALALLTGSGSDDRPTAARAPTTPATTATGAPAPQSATDSRNGESFGVPNQVVPGAAVPAPLGDLGEVGDRATLRERVVAAEGSRFATKTLGGSAAGTGADSAITTDFPCRAPLAATHPELDPVVAWGTATFHGAPAVVVTAEVSGRRVAVVVLSDTCTARKPVTIPA